MAGNFQFAFLGPQNNYLASFTPRLAKATGIPIELPKDRPPIELYGLPVQFSAKYSKLALNGHFLKIRGHDYLSHVGQYNSNAGNRHVPASDVSIREISALKALLVKGNNRSEADLSLSLGPTSGSIFADVMNRYRWANLPTELEDEIQKNICINRYGKIHDLAINSDGGWVMLSNGGRRIQYGGQLPRELTDVLSEERGSKVAVVGLYLNHQNPSEYVLLFDDGHVYISLHYAFQSQIETLLREWASCSKVKDFNKKFHFHSSSNIPKDRQNQLNAIYYRRRGLFHISRGNPELALEYLREAHTQDDRNPEILESYAMALIAMREHIQDPTLEKVVRSMSNRPINPAVLDTGNQSYIKFRNEYVWMLKEISTPLEELEDRVVRLQREANPEWSYEMATGTAGSWVDERFGAVTSYFELVGSDPHRPGRDDGDGSGWSMDHTNSYELGSNGG